MTPGHILYHGISLLRQTSGRGCALSLLCSEFQVLVLSLLSLHCRSVILTHEHPQTGGGLSIRFARKLFVPSIKIVSFIEALSTSYTNCL